jgi:hypothetical protein
MRNDLGIRLRAERVPAGDQLVAERPEVLDDAVVDDGDAARAIAVGVGVQIARPTVSGPTRVAQAHAGAWRPATERIGENGYLAGALLNEQIATLGDKSDAGGIVAPVLEAAQPVQQNWSRVSRSGVSDNSAHAVPLPVCETMAVREGG